jgi:hypothetical protein
VPPEVEEFIHETRAYRLPLQYGEETVDAYAIRQSLLTLLYTERSWIEQTVDFYRLLNAALSSDTQSQALRHASDGEDLARLVRPFFLKPVA